MLRLATARRSLYRLHHPRRVGTPLTTTLRWATGGNAKLGTGGGENKDGESKSDKVVKEYLDSLKSSAEGEEKPAVVILDSDVSPALNSSTTASSSPTSAKSSPAAEAEPSLPLGEPKSSLLVEHADRAKQSLEVWKAATVTLLRSRAQNAAGQFQELGGKLNRVTGYDEIEALKRRVVEREMSIAALRNAAREAKDTYSEAVTTRASRQRQVNDLLQRKSSWSDADVLSFTQLVREDHLSAAAEQQAKLSLEQAEAAVDTEFGALMRAILDRYHEEQVWSDKIRSVSTYGNLAVLVANMVVFVLAIVLVEPWKRKRLAETFERRITEMSEQTREMIGGGMKGLEEHFERQELVLTQLAAWAGPVPVDHERPALAVPTPGLVAEAGEPELELPAEKARSWLGVLVPSTDRDYALMAVGGVGTLAGLGLVSLFRLSRF
ncbi:sensitivity to high expression protein she9 [Ceratobasidium sp. 414]|nr:sensitivity to high expression protein she9 [Ceratobasidium sp. 414]